MRIFFSAWLALLVFAAVTFVGNRHPVRQEPMMYAYVTENFHEDTAARNAVTALLLNYRMYDTLFEALILLTAIIGMLQFLPGVASKHEREASGPDGEDR